MYLVFRLIEQGVRHKGRMRTFVTPSGGGKPEDQRCSGTVPAARKRGRHIKNTAPRAASGRGVFFGRSDLRPGGERRSGSVTDARGWLLVHLSL
jgi:hypothetical protein